MRRALALFVDDTPDIIANAQWLCASWQYIACDDTDLVFMGTRGALEQLPAQVIKITQRPVADDPEWLDYRFVNSLACLNGPGSAVLEDYDFILRSDVDVFLTPAWKSFYPQEFTTGIGYYSNDQVVKDNVKRVAAKFGLKYRDIVNIGSTLYGPPRLLREVCELATELCKYIRTVEFRDNEGEWPSWFAGVSLLYATEIAINHLIPSFAGPSTVLDFESTSDASIYEHPHIHCFHTDDRFSKFECLAGTYDNIGEGELRLDVIRDYCTAMALRARGKHRTCRLNAEACRAAAPSTGMAVGSASRAAGNRSP